MSKYYYNKYNQLLFYDENYIDEPVTDETIKNNINLFENGEELEIPLAILRKHPFFAERLIHIKEEDCKERKREYNRKYQQKPEVKERKREYNRKYYQRMKLKKLEVVE